MTIYRVSNPEWQDYEKFDFGWRGRWVSIIHTEGQNMPREYSTPVVISHAMFPTAAERGKTVGLEAHIEQLEAAIQAETASKGLK